MFYKGQLAEYLRCDVAESSEHEKVEKAFAALKQARISFDEIEQWVHLLPGWCETLRTSTVKKLLQHTSTAFERLVAEYEESVESFQEKASEAREEFLKLLQRSSDAMMVLAKNLHAKEPSLVALANKARQLSTAASTAHHQRTYTEALEELIFYQDMYEGGEARKAELKVIRVVTAAASCPLTEALTQLCEKGVIAVAVKVLWCTQDQMSGEVFEHFHSLLTAGQKLHRILGTSADVQLRQACLEVASVHLQLKEFILKAQNPEAFVKKHGDNGVEESLHLSSLLQRCQDVVATVPAQLQTEEAKSSLSQLSDTASHIVQEGQEFRKLLADAVHARTLKQAQTNLASGKALVGDRHNSNAQPLWSLKLSRESSWAQVREEASKTLLREGYGEKVKSLIANLLVDRGVVQTRRLKSGVSPSTHIQL